MICRKVICAGLLMGLLSVGFAHETGQFEVMSLLGRKLYALPDGDGAIRAAESKSAADPTSVPLSLNLSKAQAAKRQYKEAVATCTKGLDRAPNDAQLYIERGHRELGLRDFKTAEADLSRAAQLDARQLDAHYHLGLAYYFQREFAKAAESFEHARALAKTDDSLIDCSNWLYVSLRRAGKTGEAAAVLKNITPEIKNTEPHLFFYLQLLHFYQGKASEAQVLPQKPAGPSDLEHELSFNTINYGVGNWHLYNGDGAAAHPFFQKVMNGDAWNSWGFIGSELELAGK
jgi:tetratricopeptide (TPR) repeat protein